MNFLPVSDLSHRLRNFVSYNLPNLFGPDFLWSDLLDEEIEPERMLYHNILWREFNELADFVLDVTLELRYKILRHLYGILLLERQFSLERGGQEEN